MSPRRRPIILVASSFRRNETDRCDEAFIIADYLAAVVAAGGTPLLLPPGVDGPAWRDLAALGDGAMVIGGLDLDPAAYGQPRHEKTVIAPAVRHEADARLLALADRRRLPILGICLGCQAMAVHRGGTLVQHVPDRYGSQVQHHRVAGQPRVRHEVRIAPDSGLARIIGAATVAANTSHHQSVDRPGRHLRPVAWTADGLVEALEDDRPDRFFLAVQWHPEELWREEPHLALFKALVRASRAKDNQ